MTHVTQMAELWFDHEPQLDLDALAAAVPGAERMGDALVHPRFAFTLDDGSKGALVTTFLTPDGERTDENAATTEQTWDWEDADAVLARCTHSLLVAELFGSVRPYRERIETYVPTLCAAIEQLQPAAVWLPNSERVANPAAILHDRELIACLNVRLYGIEDTDHKLMDTLGLHALGLPDLQCAYEHDDPADIAQLLFDVAGYLLDHGDVIEDGDDLAERGWVCHDAVSVTEPERRALTLTRP
ncbi:DUF4261 domain-containing protein [Solirubrobacter sp. CPCC 204708]|uniref:DUF4261 domain-containing protein n=1 Tax=Solirubrobacter deserti TaxID=2282478 RepID=A0ABT4RLA2_9ACTN|nr:DUF4261 domain-containing protein [Solirubrobacter deserti]MBE2318952.1 DUF4261 domain-containing protein [Solirubrobacter deserti]MDA0139323.1 DUF4261 domain-containing protein [Solirubrobacter deserti]